MNRSRWTTLVALLLVPLLVAGGFLWGTAQADTGLRGVQAAIVNNDEMVTVNGQMMPLGRQLTAELVDSDREQNLDWVLATADKAAEGLASGRYAAVVTIPQEFSAAATSFGGDASKARQATIHVETSPVAGLDETALGQTIADAAANALNRFLTGEYLKNIYVGFNQMAAQMLEMVDGTAKLADGAGQLADGARQSADGSWQLANGLDLLAAGSPQLRSGAAQSASGADALADGLGQIAGGSPQLRSGARAAAGGADQLVTGAKQLADGTRQWAAGAGTYADGVGTFAAGAQQYADGISQYTEGVNSLVTPIRDGLDQLPEWGGWLADVIDSVTELTDRAIAFDKQVQAFVDRARAWVKEAMGLVPDTLAVRDGVTAAAKKAEGLASGTVTCPEDLAEDACAAYRAGAIAAGKQVAAALAPVADDARGVATDAAALQDTGEAILRLLDEVSKASTAMVAWAPRVQAELEKLLGSMPEGTPTTKAQLMALLNQFIDGGTQLGEGGQELAAGADKLAGGARQLADGATGLAVGTDQFAEGIGAFATGLDQLSAGVDQYTGGVDQVAGGARQLADGLGQLSSGVSQYTGGVEQTADGASRLAGGLDQLAGGAGQLAEGTKELADGVAEGAGQIPTYSDAERDNLAGVVASPVSTEGLSGLVRPNLAWVSLLLATTLWVGALATFAALPGVSRRAALSTAGTGSLLGRSLLPGVGIVAAQAVLLSVLGAVALKLTVGEGVLLGLVLLAAGIPFAAVNHALAAWFGNGGRIAALVMALVTAVTATTATAPGVFSALRSLSPVSPALDAIRAVVTGTGVTIPVFVLVGWGLVAAGASAMSVARTRTVPLAAVVGRR